MIPYSQRSKSEAIEDGRKGGINSGKARREKRALREMLKEAAMQVAQMSDREREEWAAKGYTGELTNDTIIAAASMEVARRTDEKGTSERRLLMDWFGEGKQNIAVEVEKTPEEAAAEIMERIKR